MLVSESYLRIAAFVLLLLFYARNIFGDISVIYRRFLESALNFAMENLNNDKLPMNDKDSVFSFGNGSEDAEYEI